MSPLICPLICPEALRLAAPREMRPTHADALVIRGRIVLARAQGETQADAGDILRAKDDAEAALGLARRCGYAWAQRDALCLLADTHDALGQADPAATTRRDAKALTQRLRLDPD